MGHTPGPWRQGERNSEGIYAQDCPAPIAEADSFDNARLIAAAPELLAACEEMAAQLGGGNDFAKWEAAKAKLVAAIAKAKGRA